jgi:hypothetical protein
VTKFSYDPKDLVDEKDIPDGEDPFLFVGRTGKGVKLNPISNPYTIDDFKKLMDPTLNPLERAAMLEKLFKKT